MFASLQGAEWHGTKLHRGLMYTGLICFYTRVALSFAARGDLVVPRTRLHLVNRAFSVATPTASDIRSASTLSAFKNRLKIHLFLQSYHVL